MKNMAEDLDRSGLFDEIRKFSQRKLKKVETKVTTGSGEALVEKRGAKGVQTVKSEGIQGTGYVVDHKPDLQIGLIIPGLFIASQDVAADKKILDTYEVTHILNLAYGVANVFEDDYNYKKIEILDVPETDIKQYFDECFEFIDEARHYGNCLVHCNAGVSRCTAICCAYIMNKEKKNFTDALNCVREARAFCKPNPGFWKQLEDYSDELFTGKVDQKVEDAFAARKKAEIEAEKAAICGQQSVKNKLKTFGAQLNAVFADRAKNITPMKLPLKKKPPQNAMIDSKIPPPPAPPKSAPAPPPPEPPKRLDSQRLIREPPKPVPPPEPYKRQESPKKIIINRDVTNRPVNDLQTSPKIDETPISVAAQRKQFEQNKQQNEVPKIHRIPATPKINANAESPWNRTQSPTVPVPEPEEKKKKIIIRQRSKEVAEEQPKRRTTKDLVEALERVNSPTFEQKPYGRRRTTQLDDNNVNNNKNFVSKPVDEPIRRRIRETEPPPPPPQEKIAPRTIRISSKSPTPSPSNQSTPQSNTPQPPVSNSPSPTPFGQQSESTSGPPQKLVFGRVPPPRLSISGRTLSQASQNISDVSNKVTNNDSTTSSISASASNSRSESPVLSAAVKPRNRETESQKSNSKSNTKSDSKASEKPEKSEKLSDHMVAKRTAFSSLRNASPVERSCSPSSLSANDESDEELAKPVPKMTSTLTMKLNTNKNKNLINNNENKEPEIIPKNDLKLTQNKEPSIDNQVVVNRVPLAETKDKQQSFDRRLNKSRSGLTRSSTAEILKLIKTKSKHTLALEDVEEDDEIESLLMELEKEGVDNIDWDELGVDYGEVKDIVDNAKTGDSSDEDSSDDEEESDDSDDEEAVHMVINRQAPEQESEDSDDEFEVVEDEEEDD